MVVRQLKTDPKTYELSDLHGEIIKGSFYAPELQKVDESSSLFREMNKELTRKQGKVKVSYKGWPESFDDYIDSSAPPCQLMTKINRCIGTWIVRRPRPIKMKASHFIQQTFPSKSNLTLIENGPLL